MAGYHVKDIIKGQLGELSKIQEELDEAKDAMEQGVRLMVLQELSDMLGATQHFLEKHYPGITLIDLADMAKVTDRVFKNGHRL